jgi:hypothetical protein
LITLYHIVLMLCLHVFQKLKEINYFYSWFFLKFTLK